VRSWCVRQHRCQERSATAAEVRGRLRVLSRRQSCPARLGVVARINRLLTNDLGGDMDIWT